MENISEVIRTHLESNGYKVTEVDEDGVVSMRYQMNVIHICPNKDEQDFVSMMLTGIDDVDEENPLPVLLNCLRVVTQQMVVKAYPLGSDTVGVFYEFFFLGEDDLKFQIEKGLDALISAKVKYRKYKEENDD